MSRIDWEIQSAPGEPSGSGTALRKSEAHMSKGVSFQAILVHIPGESFVHVTLDGFVACRLYLKPDDALGLQSFRLLLEGNYISRQTIMML